MVIWHIHSNLRLIWRYQKPRTILLLYLQHRIQLGPKLCDRCSCKVILWHKFLEKLWSLRLNWLESNSYVRWIITKLGNMGENIRKPRRSVLSSIYRWVLLANLWCIINTLLNTEWNSTQLISSRKQSELFKHD